MRRVHVSERVPYTAAQMFDLVNDVEAYPRFLPWCRDARIESRHDNVVVASLDIGIRGIHKSFKTRNVLDRPRSIDMQLVSGPFRRLEGGWRFEDLGAEGARVSLSLEFEVDPSPFSLVFSLMFEELGRTQMAAFISRARTVYGAVGAR
ncbi:MAG TPA: type II toxin-antitoxin system RatA family toxin [Gammaproteobacteria bacterium]